MTAYTLGIHQCAVSKVILQVCDAITTHLVPKYLRLSVTVEEMQRTVPEFETKFGMTQAFGCVDGTHIPIRRPIINSQHHFNYKQFYSRQFVMLKGCSWILTVGGLGVFVMLKCFQTLC